MRKAKVHEHEHFHEIQALLKLYTISSSYNWFHKDLIMVKDQVPRRFDHGAKFVTPTLRFSNLPQYISEPPVVMTYNEQAENFVLISLHLKDLLQQTFEI